MDEHLSKPMDIAVLERAVRKLSLIHISEPTRRS